MALSNDTINAGREGTSQLKNEAAKLVTAVNEFKSRFDGDENYQKFVSGTEVGAELSEKINTLTSIMTDAIAPSVDSIADKTNSFLDTQEVLNKMSV